MTLTTYFLQCQYENKPINSLFKKEGRKKNQKDNAKVPLIQHKASKHMGALWHQILSPWTSVGRLSLNSEELDQNSHCIVRNRGFQMRFLWNIQTEYLTPLLYSKCLVTTRQDRTRLSQGEKEVIAVFNSLMGGYRQGATRLFQEIKHKKTGGNGQGLQRGKFQIVQEFLSVMVVKKHVFVQRGCGISIL